MSGLPDLLTLKDLGDSRFEVVQPSESAEGRDVVFSGQFIAQMLMAVQQVRGDVHDIRSIHILFSRPGTYTKPIELQVEAMQAGRTFGSFTVTATQDGRFLCRAMVLTNSVDTDLMRHDSGMPSDVPGPEGLESARMLVYPGVEVRRVPGEPVIDGAPAMMFWHRYPDALDSHAANQAILSWGTCGDIIGLGIRPHRDTVDVSGAHRTFSTGVIGQTIHYLDRFDVSQWLLVVVTAQKAGSGRVYGRGRVFTQDGTLVAAYEQDALSAIANAPLDFKRSM